MGAENQVVAFAVEEVDCGDAGTGLHIVHMGTFPNQEEARSHFRRWRVDCQENFSLALAPFNPERPLSEKEIWETCVSYGAYWGEDWYSGFSSKG